MAKKKVARDKQKTISFEAALSELEQVVAKLEDGQLGLDDSLTEYEKGVSRLKECYQLLDKAERKIQLLQGVDQDGNPATEPYEDSDLSLDEKAETRGKRRSRTSSPAKPVILDADNNVDEPGGLF